MSDFITDLSMYMGALIIILYILGNVSDRYLAFKERKKEREEYL
jgi:hypothetical protein